MLSQGQKEALMPAPALLPDSGTLKKHREAGMSYDEIAERYGVTRGAVYQRLRAIPGVVTPRRDHKSLIPWTVKVEHQYEYPAMMLRLLGRELRGEPIPEDKDRMLQKWKHQMKSAGCVVDYDPNIGPILPSGETNWASPRRGGWRYVARQDGDAEWIRPPAARTLDVRAHVHIDALAEL